jgi:hypothetical protein
MHLFQGGHNGFVSVLSCMRLAFKTLMILIYSAVLMSRTSMILTIVTIHERHPRKVFSWPLTNRCPHTDSCASMLVCMEDFLREEIKGTIPRLSLTIHLCVHLSATKDGPVVDKVLPTAHMIQEDRMEFLRGSRKSP